MKTTILTSLVITGFLAASAAQAATRGSSAEELYSGLSAAAIQRIHQVADSQAVARKSTCKWHEAKADTEDFDPLYAAYPGEGYYEHEKDYLSPANMNIVC
jgi:hypothetical protein